MAEQTQPEGFKTMDEMARETEPGKPTPAVETLPDPDKLIHEPTEFNEQKVPPTADDVASNEMLWLVAKVCHEVNRAFCAQVMSDHSHLPWEETSPELRKSIYEGVVAHFENPALTPEDSHRKWMDYKRAEGWTYGNVKDAVAKTHPCMLPYHQLHAHDRAKDHLFAAVCKSMFGGQTA